MADSNQLPVLQGYWRLLEPGECTISGDEMLYRDKWLKLQPEEYNIEVITSIIRRRVPPHPTCATCSFFSAPLDTATGMCSHGSGPLQIPRDGSGYCHHHPQAQGGDAVKPLTWKWNRPEWVLLDNEHDTGLLECVGYVRRLRRKMEGFCYKCGWKLQDCTELTDAREQLVDHMVDAHELCEPVDSSPSTRETCPIPRAQANEVVTCGECRYYHVGTFSTCTNKRGLRTVSQIGSSSCSYAEPRKARGDG